MKSARYYITVARVVLGMLAIATGVHARPGRILSVGVYNQSTIHSDSFGLPAAYVVPLAADRATVGLSSEGQEIARMALSGDAAGKPFIIVDKRRARVVIFNSVGKMLGAAPALLGSAIGDDSAPGVGTRLLAQIRPAERTTPAGRFEASFGANLLGQPVLWVDYDAAVALHSVAITNPKERRLQRLQTSSLLDKRVSYGCINVPAKFFDTLVTDEFVKGGGVVYVLPETRPLNEVFTGLAAFRRL